MKQCSRLTENVCHENDGPSKSRGRGEMKLQVKKMKDQTARRENAFPDIAYHYEFDVETVSYLVRP